MAARTPRVPKVRDGVRRGGLHLAWAIIVFDDRTELPCWIINESPMGMGLETRTQVFPCPLEVKATYWMRIKPIAAQKEAWIAATVKHFKEKTTGSGIYRIGMRIASAPPVELGKSDEEI